MVEQARSKSKTNIFKLGGNIYTFDSTTIDLCLSVFWWTKFRKRKGEIKIHTLYDIETQISTFFHTTTASVHDSRVMDKTPHKAGAYYIFDRGYNHFKSLFGLKLLVLILLLEQSQTYSSKANIGNVVCRKVFCRMLLMN